MKKVGNGEFVRLLLLYCFGIGNELPAEGQDAVMSDAGLQISNEDRIRYHMAEFTALKSEIAELIKQTYAYLTYAVGISGAIFSWLLTRSDEETNMWWMVFLPWLITFFYSQMAIASRRRINLKGGYLKLLEGRFSAPGLGWERTFAVQRESIGRLHAVAWVVLFWGTFCIAIIVCSLELRKPSGAAVQKPIQVQLVP